MPILRIFRQLSNTYNLYMITKFFNSSELWFSPVWDRGMGGYISKDFNYLRHVSVE